MNGHRRPAKAGVGSNQYVTRPGAPTPGRENAAGLVAAVEHLDPTDSELRREVTELEAAARVVIAAQVLREQVPGGTEIVNSGTGQADRVLSFAVHIARLARDAGLDIDADLRVTGEDRVAFAFTNPEASASGINPVACEEDQRMWDNPARAAAAHRLGSTWWDAPRDFGGAIPVEWSRHGWVNPDSISAWDRIGFTPVEARQWSTANFAAEGPVGAGEWTKHGFALDDAIIWRDEINKVTTADKVPPGSAAAWRDAGFTAEETRDSMNAGHTFKSACKARSDGTLPAARLGPNGIPGRAWSKVEGIAQATNRAVSTPRLRAGGEWAIEITQPGSPHKQVRCLFGRAGNFKKAVLLDSRRSTYGGGSEVTALKNLSGFLDRHLGASSAPPADGPL